MNTTRLLIASLSVALMSALPALAHDADDAASASARPLTRAEVLADLQLYRESGLAAVDRTEDFSLNADLRAAAEARYAQLKASPRYAELVRQFAANGAKASIGSESMARQGDDTGARRQK